MLTLLSAISVTGENLITAVVWLLIAAVVYFILQWGVNKINPEQPFRKVIDVILVIAVIVLVINALLSIIGKGFFTFT